jgi:membrane fusion protein (multidrug efflux system)
VRQVQSLFETAQQQQAQVLLRKAQLQLAQKNYHRDKNLVAKNVIPQSRFDKTVTALEAAEANVALAKHQLSSTQAKISRTTVENHPEVKLAEDQVRKAYLALKRTQILAPVTGYVANRTVQVGQDANPGKAMMTVVPLRQVWVNANFKETSLASVRVGQPVTLTADLYGGNVTYHGKVVGLSAGTGAAFELLPPQNATGNWIKVVRRLPVRVRIKPKELRQHPLHIGLSMSATVNIHNQKGARLAGRPGPRAGYRTVIFKHRMRGVRAIINKIVNDNIVTKLNGKKKAQARNAKAKQSHRHP